MEGHLNSAAESPEGVAFLTALLVRYPEVGSACLSCGGSLLRLDFYIHRHLEEGELEAFAETLRLSWAAFFSLMSIRPERTEVQRSEARRGHGLPGLDEDDELLEVDSLQILRDLQTVTPEELAMVVSLVCDAFEEDLALNEDAASEDQERQEEMIHRSLEKVRSTPGEAALTGFRDDMRVLIYASHEE